jgi:SPP1 gp7 family putative phage head morphogenesis protein
MPTIYSRAREFRRQLLDGELQAQRRLAEAFDVAFGSVQREIDQLGRQIEEARRQGENVTRSWLFRNARLERLAEQFAFAGLLFGRSAAQTIASGQESAIFQATEHSRDLIGGTFQRGNVEAVRELVGTLGDGSPLRDVLQSAAKDAAGTAQSILTTAVATGESPRVAARKMRDAAAVPEVRASTIARTEILRSYRSASTANYEANSDVLEGWVWLATLDKRTCSSCWLMHGKQFPVSQDFASHPRCRCSPMPKLIGVPAGVEAGQIRLERASESIQRQVLGPRTLEAYRNGQIRLEDLVRFEHDPEWGPQLRRVPLAELLAEPQRKAA